MNDYLKENNSKRPDLSSLNSKNLDRSDNSNLVSRSPGPGSGEIGRSNENPPQWSGRVQCPHAGLKPACRSHDLSGSAKVSMTPSYLQFSHAEVLESAISTPDKALSLIPLSTIDQRSFNQLAQWLEKYRLVGPQLLLDESNAHTFIIHDTLRNQVVLWRSYQSQETLYWHIHHQQLLFSPSLTGLIQAGQTIKPSKSALVEYLYFGFVPNDNCLAQGIHKINPGQALIYQFQEGHYWHIQAKAPWQRALDEGSLCESELAKSSNIDPQSSQGLLNPLPSLLNPLQQIWLLQEPRHDLWMNYPSSFLASPMKHLENLWLGEYSHFQLPQTAQLPKPWPGKIQQLVTWLEMRTSGDTFLGRWLRYQLQQLFYRPLAAHAKRLDDWSVFDSHTLSLKFKGLQQLFSTQIWLQEQIDLPLQASFPNALSKASEAAVKGVFLQLSAQSTIHPLWTYKAPRIWSKTSYRWMNPEDTLSRLLNRAYYSGVSIAAESSQRAESSYLNEANRDLHVALLQMRGGYLTDLGIVGPSYLEQLALEIKDNAGRKERRVLRQTTTLVALELWLRLFIDQQGQIKSEMNSWQRLMNIPSTYP